MKQLVQQEFHFNTLVPLRADGTGDTTRTEAVVLSPTRAPVPGSSPASGGLRPAMRDGAQPTRAPTRTERKAALLPDSPMPNYPAGLQSQGITGGVDAAFIVGPDGRVDVATFKVLRSDHELFTQAVKDALPRLRFSPPEVDGRRVRQLIEMPFTFGSGG